MSWRENPNIVSFVVVKSQNGHRVVFGPPGGHNHTTWLGKPNEFVGAGFADMEKKVIFGGYLGNGFPGGEAVWPPYDYKPAMVKALLPDWTVKEPWDHTSPPPAKTSGAVVPGAMVKTWNEEDCSCFPDTCGHCGPLRLRVEEVEHYPEAQTWLLCLRPIHASGCDAASCCEHRDQLQVFWLATQFRGGAPETPDANGLLQLRGGWYFYDEKPRAEKILHLGQSAS